MTATYDLFQQDWSSSPRVETAWQTHVSDAAGTLAEERCQLRARPGRVVTARWVGVSRAEAQRILFQVLRSGSDRTRVPIYADQAITTAASSGTTINCPTAYRRFAAGALVAIHELVGGRAANVQYRTVSSVGASSLTLTAGLTGTYPAGSLVYPVVTAEVVLERRVPFQTNRVCTLEVSFLEVAGSTAIPALGTGLANPAGFPTATVEGETYPVLDLDPEWSAGVEVGFLRPGEDYDRGRGHAVYARGARALWSWEIPLLLPARETAWSVLRFHDAMRGRTGAFWATLPADVWRAVDYATGYVEIEAAGNLADAQDLLSHVAVHLSDGSINLRRVSTVTLVGSDWRITPTEALPAGTLANVVRVAPAALARFDSDSIEEEWITDQVLRTRLAVRELTSEAAVASISAPEACP